MSVVEIDQDEKSFKNLSQTQKHKENIKTGLRQVKMKPEDQLTVEKSSVASPVKRTAKFSSKAKSNKAAQNSSRNKKPENSPPAKIQPSRSI